MESPNRGPVAIPGPRAGKKLPGRAGCSVDVAGAHVGAGAAGGVGRHRGHRRARGRLGLPQLHQR